MRLAKRSADESGVALITALLAIMLMSALMVGMFAALATDQRSHAVDRDQTQAYAAAQAGLEKLTSGLATLFSADVSPSVTQINAVALTPPVIAGFSFKAPGGVAGSGYAITYAPDAQGNPLAVQSPITTGPFTGFNGLITKYTATITALSTGGAEVRLRRDIQTVAVPVFQFGIFSDTDLTFYAGDTFAFGGRVHTNQNLFLCEFGASMTFADRITAVSQVVRNYFSNGLLATTYGCGGPVLVPTSPSTTRNLTQSPNEGSIVGMPGSAANANWTTISTGTYKSYIRTSLTGAKRLDLPLVSQGATPIDLIRRPALNSAENTANPPVFGQRYFSQASLRILLSDRVADLTGLPTVTGTAPVLLDGNWLNAAAPPVGRPVGYAVDATHPPIARSMGPVFYAGTATQATVAAGATAATITVTNTVALPGIPLGSPFRMPFGVNLSIGGNAAVTCTGKSATQFLGCNLGVAVVNGAPVTAILPSGLTVTTTAQAAAAGAAVAVTINTPAGGLAAWTTAPFSVNSFFINGVQYTCMGYNAALAVGAGAHTFTQCAGGGAPTAGAVITSSGLADQNTGTIGGYIKIEKQDALGNWTDVTTEILNLGVGAPNQGGTPCADPTPNAVIRIQRLRDNGGNVCAYAASQNSWDWWPNQLFDTRESNYRDMATNTPMNLSGVIGYVSLDTANLKRWFSGALAGTGATALNNNGYIVYFSDRRGDHNELLADVETGEFGFEDRVNPNTAAGTNDGALQTGEDMNGNATQQLYGQTPHPLAIPAWTNAIAPAGNDPFSLNGRPWTAIPTANAGIARVNKVVLFRRALKLINGGIVAGVNNLPTAGLTIAAENPVYVQGNYNATTDPNAEPNVPASVIADAVTLLSNGWTDYNSFVNPNLATSRNATTTGYRMAVVAGKGLSFPYCAANCGSPQFLFGTDGGVGNFLRLLEDWNIAGVNINYRGSIVTLHISRQATGTFKFNTNVYNFGVRNFSFDTDFLTPALLPPGTPMFRDINTLKFRQILRPNQ